MLKSCFTYVFVAVNWDAVGGLDHHIQSLKEMVMFPLLYPEIYDRFNITPPRGVLFYGPPGLSCVAETVMKNSVG